MNTQKATVLKVTASKSKKIIEADTTEVLESNDFYIQVCHPFYNFIYEEIEKLRRNKNEIT